MRSVGCAFSELGDYEEATGGAIDGSVRFCASAAGVLRVDGMVVEDSLWWLWWPIEPLISIALEWHGFFCSAMTFLDQTLSRLGYPFQQRLEARDVA